MPRKTALNETIVQRPPVPEKELDGIDLVEAATNLFSDLRMLDESGVDTIAVMPVPNEGLGEARENIEQWCRYVLGHQFARPSGWELQNMLCVARLMIHAALARCETRGCHVRTDFPQRDDEHWNRHIVFRRGEE